jgi:hypothetical protein
MLLGHTELNSPGTENLISYLRAALDAVAKVPEQGLRLARGMPAMVVGGRQLWPKRLRS